MSDGEKEKKPQADIADEMEKALEALEEADNEKSQEPPKDDGVVFVAEEKKEEDLPEEPSEEKPEDESEKKPEEAEKPEPQKAKPAPKKKSSKKKLLGIKFISIPPYIYCYTTKISTCQ